MNRAPRRGARQDRGLTTAHERHCVSQLMDTWATRYDVRSVVEGPLDGIAGVAGVHAAGLARGGIAVSSFVTNGADATTARAVYEAAGGSSHATIGVVNDVMRLDDLPTSDMVLSYNALLRVDDWRAYVRLLAKHARKVLIVTVSNPKNWAAGAMRLARKLGGTSGPEPLAPRIEDELAAVLWDLGRVRECVYFDRSWWSEVPHLPGTSALARATETTGGKLGHRLARMQAFVVDVQARTPQARRRLTQV